MVFLFYLVDITLIYKFMITHTIYIFKVILGIK